MWQRKVWWCFHHGKWQGWRVKHQVAQEVRQEVRQEVQEAPTEPMQESNLAETLPLPNLLARHGQETCEVEKTAKSQGQILVDPPLATCVVSHWFGSHRDQSDLATVVASLKNTKAPEAPNQDRVSITKFRSGYVLICIFDGHGKCGHFVAERAVQTVPWIMANEGGFDTEDVDEASIEKARTKTDLNHHHRFSYCSSPKQVQYLFLNFIQLLSILQ